MSTFSFNKSGNDGKSNTLGSMNRQNVIQETNKKRTLLKDSSWIKSRPEEEEEKIRDENFGKSVLSRYKSQEDLDSGIDKEENKPTLNRFKSDDALDRIPSRNTFQGGNKAATLERVPMSGPEVTNKNRQSWAPSNKTTTTTTTEESKRKSWAPTNKNTTTTTTTTTTNETRQVGPTKPDGQKITIISSDTKITDKQPRSSFVDNARSRFEKSEEKPSPPTSPRLLSVDDKAKLPPRSPIAKTDDWPSYPSKPLIPETGERRSAVERKQRSQDIDSLIEVSTSKIGSNKSTQDVDNLIDIKPTSDKGKKRDQLDDFIEISSTAKNFQRKDDNFDNLIEIKKPDVKTRNQNLDNLIDIKTTPTVKGSKDLDDLIVITGDANKGTPKPISSNTNLTTRSSTTTTTYNVKEETGDAQYRRPTTTTTYNVKEETGDAPYRRSTTTSKVTDYQNVPSRLSTTSSTYKVTDNSYDAPTRRSTTSYNDTTDGQISRPNVTVNEETSYSSLPNSSYGDVRKFSSNTYGQDIVSNSIKTVYSTSDRSVMEKDICTYCRKPLGIDAKMILKDLSICCHATCFKCEACSGSLGNLKAGDSMWIYKHTIHCEPCYFNAREKWII